MREARSYIGTSGWNYDDRRGRFYPEGMSRDGWLEDGRTVYAYFNNDHRAHAPRDAQRLREMLRG